MSMNIKLRRSLFEICKVVSTVQACSNLQKSCNLHHKNLSVPPQKELFTSRFHPRPPIENAELKIKDILVERNPHDFSHWESIREDVLIDHSIISDVNFNTIIMNCLLNMNSLKMATSFMKYLNESGMEPNLLTQLKYMSLCSKNRTNCGEDVILEVLEKVKPFLDNTPVLDLKRADYLIHGLCSTKLWRLSFEYLKKLQPNTPSISIRNHLAAAAIRNSDDLLAWQIFTKWFSADEFPSNEAVMEFILYARKLQLVSTEESDSFILKLLEYLQKKNYIVEADVSREIGNYFYFYKNKWKISFANVSRKGFCEACQKPLEIKDWHSQDFITLKELFLEKSIKKSDLFINTTASEFNRYIRYINNHKPFDLVIDGLNTAHAFQGNTSKQNLAFHLLNVVNNLLKSYPKILVLGRVHMNSWPKPVMRSLSDRAYVFLTNNISQDDPFMVYAALASGPGAFILSSDLMRDHISRLADPHFIRLFRRWQLTHQMFIEPQSNNSLKFIEPLQHSITIQGDMQNGWHIPYDDKIILDPYEELNSWLCIQKCTNK